LEQFWSALDGVKFTSAGCETGYGKGVTTLRFLVWAWSIFV